MPVISDVRHPLMYYDTNTLSLLLWDGSLQAGGLVIGHVIVDGLTFNGAFLKTTVTPEEGAVFTVNGGYSADTTGPLGGAIFLPTLTAASHAAEQTFTENRLNALSMDLNGRLRTIDSATYICSIEYDANHLPLYRGLAPKGSLKSQAVWQMTKFTTDSTNITDWRYANASDAFNAIYDNRAALSYS